MRGLYGITSCDIILRVKKRDGSGYRYSQFRCLENGRPEHVGLDLQDIVHCWQPYLFNVFQLMYDRGVCNVHGVKIKYELVCREHLSLNRDISYLYVVDFDKRKIYCYYVDLSSKNGVSDEEIVNSDKLDDTMNIKKTLVYESNFRDEFTDINFVSGNVNISGIRRDMFYNEEHFRNSDFLGSEWNNVFI